MADPVKPLVVHLICSSGFYGAERVVANIAQTFTGVDMQVLCLAPPAADLSTFSQQVRKNSTCSFVSIPNSLPLALKQLRELSRCHNKLIVHAHGYKEIVIAVLFKWLSDCQVIVTQHGFTERNLKSRVYNWIDKACCRWASIDSVIAVSEDIARIYRDFGVHQNRITIVKNAVALPERQPSLPGKPSDKERFPLPAGKRRILFAGRLSEEKAPLLFVDAIAELVKTDPDTIGVIAGDGPQAEEVQQAISRMHLQDKIICLGFISNMDQLLPAVDMVMLTSVTEGVPMTMLEAMANGVPVVAAAVGGIPGVIQDASNG
ncbi:MAG: glycosyltransferase family 4 protein, partial [Ketobacteraceae bacterium]|nr:glycosyltransferase family 4 protein [Ketobacteraceae bacterium]